MTVGGESDLLLPGETHERMAGRFKDHRKSYGLEFIDIRKEINAELKQHGVKRHQSPKGVGHGKSTIESKRAAGYNPLRDTTANGVSL